ncbi:Macrolide export ATP-binding/permease protein MacB [Anaerolineae bacterium]|nr:Macrolide export ATP-binding/permease protein MacB [Anaerolineae bacterium]
MNVWESLRIALRSLSANKLRSGLTMLGIIIGVMAVIAMLSIGRGTQAAITNQINSIGTNLLYIRPGATQQGGVRAAEGSAATLTMEDGEALAGLPDVVAVAPQVESFGQVAYLGNNANARILGVTPEYPDAINANLATGEFISAANVTTRAAIAVLGSQIATTLFDTADPIGQMVRINAQNFRVVGVMEAKGGTGFMNADTQVFVPLTTALSRLNRGGQFRGGNSVSVLNVKITDSSAQDSVVQSISDVLRERHRSQFQDDFSIQSQQDILNTANQVTGTLTIFLGGVAAISLIVGGIGIMNIMLVSVTERTREIGLRKAIGARKGDILFQFLTEAMILSLAGGLLGVMLGALIARIISGVQMGTTTLNTVVDLDSALLAVVFSAGIGLFFGSYPANRAASLHPIDALRYE